MTAWQREYETGQIQVALPRAHVLLSLVYTTVPEACVSCCQFRWVLTICGAFGQSHIGPTATLRTILYKAKSTGLVLEGVY